jgi:hypothetical protein
MKLWIAALAFLLCACTGIEEFITGSTRTIQDTEVDQDEQLIITGSSRTIQGTEVDQDDQLLIALERIDALEEEINELAVATTDAPRPTTTTKPAPQFSRISAPYARKIATDALADLTGRASLDGFEKRVERWTEEFIMANPGVTDLAPEEFDAWFREKIEEEYAVEVKRQRTLKTVSRVNDLMSRLP